MNIEAANTKAMTKFKQTEKRKPELILKSVKPLKSRFLLKFLTDKGVSEKIACKYVQEIRVHNKDTSNDITAIGVLNEDEGYALYNAVLNANVNGLEITFFRGKNVNPTGIHIFQDIYDYLALLTQKNIMNLKEDVIILHSLHNLSRIRPYIRGYGYKNVYSWLENTSTGKSGMHYIRNFLSQELDTMFMDMSIVYSRFKNLQQWLLERLNTAIKY